MTYLHFRSSNSPRVELDTSALTYPCSLALLLSTFTPLSQERHSHVLLRSVKLNSLWPLLLFIRHTRHLARHRPAASVLAPSSNHDRSLRYSSFEEEEEK